MNNMKNRNHILIQLIIDKKQHNLEYNKNNNINNNNNINMIKVNIKIRLHNIQKNKKLMKMKHQEIILKSK